jgi:Tfp pilus assembly protein PilO
MSDWPLRISLALAACGRWPLLAAALIAAAVGMWGIALPLLDERLAQERGQLEAQQRAPRRAEPMAEPVVRKNALAEFDALLAEPAEATRLMQQLWQRAAASGVQLQRVDYRVEPDRSGEFGRLLVSLPVKGSYADTRKFIFSLMADFPALALDKLDLKREPRSTGPVEATVHFTLMTRP